MKNTQKKKITRNYHLLMKVESGKCRGVRAEYPQYAPVYNDMTGRGTQPSTSHASIAQENTLSASSVQASASQASSPWSSQSSPNHEPVDTGK